MEKILRCNHSNKSSWVVLSCRIVYYAYMVVLTFESVDEILWCDHSNESYWAVLSCGTVYYAVQGGSNFSVCGWNPMVWPFKWVTEQYFPVLLFTMLYMYKVVLTFESEWNPKVWPFIWTLLSSFQWYCL